MGSILKIIKGSFGFWREGRPEEEKRETEGFGYSAGGIVAGTMPGSQKESPAVFGCHLAAKDLVQPVNKPVAPYFFKKIYKNTI